MASSAPDMYGQVHPVETPELLTEKLNELEAEIQKIKDEEKKCYKQALEKEVPMDDAFKLKFLRCEQFRADDAASRLMKYWDKRVEIFGDEKAFLPLTLGGALEGEDKALKLGFVRLLPGKDPAGRAIIYADPSRYGEKKERVQTVRAMWYTMHAALEDEDAQKKGAVIIADPRNAKFSQTDTKLDKMNIQSIRGCIPVRVAAFHLCHMPAFFSIIFPIIKVFLGERLRKRIKLHQGSVEHVIERLAQYGLTSDMLPEQLGGAFKLDHEQWLADRKAKGL